MMSQKAVISSHQAFLLIFFANISTVVFFVPGETAILVGQDAWISVIIGTLLVALSVYYPLADLGTNYPDKTMVQYSQDILGKPLGKLIGFMFLYYFFSLHCWTIRTFGEMFVALMPETPKIVFIAVMALIIAYAVYNGLEVIGRCAEFVFPIGMLFLALIWILSLSEVELTRLMPIYEYNLGRYLFAAIGPFEWLSTGFVLGMFSSELSNKKNLKKVVLMSIAFSGLVLVTTSIVTIATFGSGILQNINFPLLSLARYSESRIEAVIMVYWITWVFIRGSIYCYAALTSLKQLFNLSDYKWFIIPETILAVAYSNYQYDSFVELGYLFSTAHFYYMSFSVMLPLSLWIIFKVRFRK